MSDTFWTHSSDWGWAVTIYFFLGGIAGGSYVIAALIDLFGAPEDRPLARLGYYVALPAVALCGPLLIVDLNRPERFWHLLIESKRGLPMFKYWSPMSFGSWILLFFGLFAFLSLVGALAEEGWLKWAPLRALRRGALGRILAAVGLLFGFGLAGYTGVLLEVTNRPIWADTTLLGLLFVVSAASTAGALLLLLGRPRRAVLPETLGLLTEMDRWVLLTELVVLVALILSLGMVAQVWLSAWGVLLAVGVVLLGILIPLLLEWRGRPRAGWSVPAAACLVLIGGFILRAVIVLSSEAV
jgi:formate-dependent nitrite reductase membrane component NrfD